tara:strand:+ start:4767 stop:22040 length:17274 start_codon:yes stop_codon:yes gene_type:complete
MSDNNSLQNLLDSSTTEPVQLNPVTNLPMKPNTPNIIKGASSVKGLIDGTYQDPARDESYFSNPINLDDPYDMKRVDWPVYDRSQIDHIRNANQTHGGRLLAFLNRATAEIGGGTLYGFGALGDLIVNGTESTYENFVTDIGQSWMDMARDVSPIFRKHPEKGWDPSDPAWWAENSVSLVSTLSLLIPAAGTVKAVGMVGKGLGMAGKTMRASARVSKLGKNSLKWRVGTALAKVPRLGGKSGQALGSMTIGGLSMRYMENYREAGETFLTSFDKNLEFFSDDVAFNRFLDSQAGKEFLDKYPDLKLDDPLLKEHASKWIAGQAAHKSFNMNWTNAAFDILQYGLVFGHLGKLGRGTRASFLFPHGSKVKAAQNAMLHAPKIAKSRLGRIWQNYGKTGAKWGAWAYSEGIEEQVNWISMQEGIRYGDIMAGNTGIMNPDWGIGGFGRPEFSMWPSAFLGDDNRKKVYSESGEYWSSTLFGAMGGGGFTMLGGLYNRKTNKARQKRQIEEIGKRQEFVIAALGKRAEYQKNGNLEGVKEQNRLLAVNLGLNAAQAGTVDLLLQQINDENFDQLLLDNGLAQEEIDQTKKEIIDVVEQSEKKYRNYSNRIFGTEYGAGASRAVAELEMVMDMYSELMEDIDTRTEEIQESTKIAEEKSQIGTNTKRRRQIQTEVKSLEMTLEKVKSIIENLENDSTDPSISKEEKEQTEATLANFKRWQDNYNETLKLLSREGADLENNSKETYTTEQFQEEQDYLNENNRTDVVKLANQKQIYKANRLAAWKQLNEILSGEYEFTVKEKSDKIEDALLSEKETKKKLKMNEADRAEIEKRWNSITKKNAKAAENDATVQDFLDLLSNPDTNQDQIDLFLDEYADNKDLQTLVKPLIANWRSRKNQLQLQASIDNLRKRTKELNEKFQEGKEIENSDQVINEVMRLLNEIWGVEGHYKDSQGNPLSKKQQQDKQRDYNWAKNLTKFIVRYKHGIPESLNWEWSKIFDNFVPNLQVMWGNRIGVIYTESGTLYFEDESQHKTAVTKHNDTLFNIDMIVLKNSTTVPITIEHDGRTFNIKDNYYSNLHGNPTEAIEYNKDDIPMSVTLTTWQGKDIKITTPGIVLDISRVIETLEAVKRAKFYSLTKEETKLDLGEGYTAGYEKIGKNYDLIIRKDGKKVKGKRAQELRHLANEILSEAIEKEINNIKKEFNESTTTHNVTPTETSKEALSGPTGQAARVSQEVEGIEDTGKKEEKITAEANSASPVVNVDKAKVSEKEKKAIIDEINEDALQTDKANAESIIEEEKKKNEDNLKEETSESIDNLLSENKSDPEKTVDLIDSSVNQQVPGPIKKGAPQSITNPTATNKNKVELDRAYPQAWVPQYIGVNLGTKENPLWVQAADRDGNPIPMFVRANGAPYRIIPESWLTPQQLDKIDAKDVGSGTVVTIWYNEPRKNESNQIIREGNRIITNKEKQVRYTVFNTKTKKRENAVMVIYPGSVNQADIIDFDIANSPKTGVGTNVILRVEPNWQYYRSNDPNDVIITVRLASNPDTILSTMRGGKAAFKQNLLLRKNVAEALKGNRSMDIKAKIAGKTDGFVNNIKKKGKSVKQPLSILEGDIVLGYGIDGTIRIPNSDVSVSNSQYVENGTIYIAMPSSSGRMIPIRLETSNLNNQAASKILEIILDNKLTEELRRSQVNKIVQVYGKLEEDTELAMDNYRVKFPYGGKMIGLQIHPEGSDQISNFEKFILGQEFKYILYDNKGLIESAGQITKEGGEIVQKILRDSTDFSQQNLVDNKNVFVEYLKTKKYNVQGHELNVNEPYLSPINNLEYNNYLEYLSDPDMSILTTDIPGGTAAKFHHSIIYTEVVDDTTKLDTPFTEVKLTKQEVKEFSQPAIDEEVVNAIEDEATLSIDDLIQKRQQKLGEFDYNFTLPTQKGGLAALQLTDTNGAEVGVLNIETGSGTIQDVVVQEAHQGKGLGTQMYKLANDLLAENNLPNLKSGTQTSAPAARIWEKLVTAGEAKTAIFPERESHKQEGFEMMAPKKQKQAQDIDNIDDINLPDIKLREVNVNNVSYDILTDQEVDWFKEKFGEQGLNVLSRVKWIRVSKGINAWGFYQNGLVTLAKEGKEGTAYWEAFRRVFDIHLSEEEKSDILLEAGERYGYDMLMEQEARGIDMADATYSTEQLETALAKDFMNFMLNEKDPSFKGKIKRFFKELLYAIKNFLGAGSTIDRVFRNIRDTQYKDYTREKLNKLSKVENPQLRQMYNKNGQPMPQEFVEEVVGNINHDLYSALQKKAKENNVSFETYLKDPKQLDQFYDTLRKQYIAIGKKILETPGISDRVRSIGENYLRITDDSLWGIRTDALHNLTSPGFKKLAIQNLQPLFGVKYTTYRGQEITDDLDANEVNDIVEETEPQAQEKIHGINFYYRPVKDTLSKDVKIGLSFIESKEKGKLLGKHRFIPFDDVYNYLALNLSNSTEGRVMEKLKTLQHELVPQVLQKYAEAGPAWQNKFITHFNKQNIAFKTLVIENNGTVKVMYTNRNGLERQIINDWMGNKSTSSIFTEVSGKDDIIDTKQAKLIQSIIEKDLVNIHNKYRNINSKTKQSEGKKEYMVPMMKVLKSLGIILPQNMKNDLFVDEAITVQDLHKYMFGSNSFQYIFKNLVRGISPYMANNMEMGALGKLAKFVSQYKIDSYLSSFIGGNRKSIYSINLNTFDSERTLSLRSEETYKQVIGKYFNDVFYKPNANVSHIILDMLSKHPDVRNNFQLSTFDVIKEKGSFGRATAYDRMTENLSALTRFSMFNNSGNRFAEFSTGTKSDKGQFKFISLPKIHPKNKAFGMWKSTKLGIEGFIETAVELIRPLALGEYARISKTERQLFDIDMDLNKQIKNLHYKNEPGDNLGNGLKFMLFRMLNESELFNKETNRLEAVSDINDSNVEVYNRLSSVLDGYLRSYISKQIRKTIDAFVDAKAIMKVGNEIHNINLPIQAISNKAVGKDITLAIVEFAVNDVVMKPYINTIFGPELAFYKTDPQGNPMVDAGKRQYQSVTPKMNLTYNEEHDYGAKPKFNHAVVRDIFKRSPETVARFKKILENAGVSSKKAEKISNKYLEIIKTDAQGYTTLEFHKRQMESQGKWSKEHDNAYETYWVKGLMGGKAEQELLLDPLKTYFFGEVLENDGHQNETLVFKQIKHSTIPLMRGYTEIFKEDNLITLDDLRQRMEATGKYKGMQPIDMVNFESGVKVGLSGISNLQHLDQVNVEVLDTKYLGSPQIITTKQKDPLFGSQFAKLVPSNINNDNSYTLPNSDKLLGSEIKSLYNDLWYEKIQRSSNKLSKKLGYKTFMDVLENRNQLSEKEFAVAQLKFLKKVKNEVYQMLQERELPDNYFLALDIEALIDDVNRYDYVTPMAFPTFSKRFENILLSLFKNNILKQRSKGISAVQVADFGWSLTNELQIKANSKGGIYAEVALPYDLVHKLGLQVGDNLSEVDQSLLELVGYRIPTQGKNSMLALKVTKILPKNMGSIIQLPAEITTIMGSDFDIDKMYIIFPELTKDKKRESAFKIGQYRTKKSFEGLSDQAVNQALFDISHSILASKHSVEEILTPLDSDTYAEAIKDYREARITEDISDFDVFTPAADMYLEKINKDAAMLIGLFSMNSTSHALAQDMDITLKDGAQIYFNSKKGQEHTSLSNIYDFDGNYISDHIKDDQNESIDNAKNQRIGPAGVTVYNHGVKMLLNRVGVSGRASLDFINQPMIKEYQKERATNTNNISDIKLAEKVAEEWGVKQEFLEAKKLFGEDRFFTPSSSSLKTSLKHTKGGQREHKVQQAQLLADFFNYLDISRDMSKLNTLLNPEGLKNFSRLSYLENFKNAQAHLESTTSYIKIGQMPKRTEAFIKFGIDEAIETTSYFIPFNKEGFLELKRKIAKYTGQRDGVLSQESIETINSLALYYVFTQPESPLADLFYKDEKADMALIKKRLFTLSESTVSKFLNLRSRKNLHNDKFFGMLFSHRENTGKNRFIKLLAFNNASKLDSSQKSAITDRWEQLLDPNVTKDIEVRRMAEALVLYSIITSGFISTGPNTFVDLIPNSYWSNKSENKDSLSNFFRKEARTMEYSDYFDDNAARQIIRNAFKDPGLLITVNKTALIQNSITKDLGLSKNHYFIHKDAASDILIKDSPGTKAYVDYFKLYDNKWRLFQLHSVREAGAIYHEIPPLGERYKFVEMVSKDALIESIHPGNQTKHKQVIDQQLENLPPNSTEATESIDDIIGMPQLAAEKVLKTKIQDLEGRLLSWLKKEFNIGHRSYNVLKTKTGKDALGIADIMHKVIHLSNKRDRYTIPEETAHFFIEMLKDKTIIQKLMELSSKTKLHGEVLRDYAEVYNTPEEFMKETAGKILGKYIVSEYYEQKKFSIGTETEFIKEYRGLLGLLQRIWDRIRSIFVGESANKELNRHIRDVFGQKARQILNGSSLGLDVNLLRTNTIQKYYSIGSVMGGVGKLGEGALNKIGKTLSVFDFSDKQLKELGEKGKSLLKRKASWNQSNYITELLADSNRITAPTGEEQFYTKDGIQLTRVTGVQDYFTDAFAEEEMAVKIAKANRAKGDVFNSAERVLNLWKFLQEGGTEIHKVMQGLIEGKTNDQIMASLNMNPKSKKAIQNSISLLKTWVQEKFNKGSKLYAEVKVADMVNLMAGTIDVIEQTSGGRIFLHDFKSKVAGKLVEIEKRLPNFKYALSGLQNTALNQYRLQLSLYKYILEKKGVKVDGIKVQPLEVGVNITPESGDINYTSISFPSATSPVLNKLNNLKPIDNTILSNVLKKLNPESTGVAEELREKDATVRVLQQAKDVIKKKIERYKKSGNPNYLSAMQELSKQLEEVSEKEGIVLFVKRALKEINDAHKRLLQLQKDDAITARNLAEIRNYVSAYEILDEMTLLAPTLGKTGYENLINKYVAPAVLKRQQVEELYKALGRPIIAEFLTKYSTKPGMTKVKMEAELIKASRDIGYLARWLSALADSKMTELAMVDKHVGIQRNIVQEAKYNLEYGAGKSEGLLDILKEYENHRVEQGSSATNYVQLFEPILEMHNGKPTGYIVGPQSYEFRQKKLDFIKTKKEAGEAITARIWNEFYEENKFIEDPKYLALMKLPESNPIRKFYDFFIENYKYAQSILPSFARRGLMLPGLRKTPQERFMETSGLVGIKGGWSAIKEAALQKFTITEDETEYKEKVDEKGDAMHYVPIHYSEKIGTEEGMLNPEDASYDLSSALSMYYTMAVNNQQMNEIIAELELTKELVRTRKVVKLKAGMPVIDSVTDAQVTTEGVQSLAYDRLVDYLNMVVYGERKKRSADVMTMAGKKVTTDKVMDGFLSYNSLRVLALNPHAGYVNVAFGNLMNSFEAYAGQYFGKKNFIKSKAFYWGGLSGILKDTIGRVPTSKIGLMNEYYNVLQHFDEFGNRIKHKSLAMRGMHTGAFFFMMTMGEHMLQTQLFISMALEKKFKLANGKTINLWDATKVENGKLTLHDEVAEQFNETDRAIFKERVQGVYQRLHGIYNMKDRNAIQQYAAGRWVMQLRKWMPSGFQRRFEGIEKLWYDKKSEFAGAEWNERLQSYVEGNYITMLRFMNQLKWDIAKLKIYTIKEKWNELDTWQQQNVKRTIGEIAGFFVLIALSGLVRSGDEDEEKGYVYYQSLYTLHRMKQELLFFSWVPETFNVLKAPAASITSLEVLVDLVGQLLEDTGSIVMGQDLERYKRKTGMWDKGDPKIWSKLYKTLPLTQLTKKAKDKLSWFHLN